jgi:hypothetical protein
MKWKGCVTLIAKRPLLYKGFLFFNFVMCHDDLANFGYQQNMEGKTSSMTPIWMG